MSITKKILFFHEVFPAGGAERVTLDIADYVSARGYQVYVLTCELRRHHFQQLSVIQAPEKYIVKGQLKWEYIISTIEALSIDIFVLPVCPSHDLLAYVKKRTRCKVIFALHSVPLWEVIYSLYGKKKHCGSSLVRLALWYLIVYPKTMWIKKYNHSIINIHKKVYDTVDRYTVLCEGYRGLLLRKMKISSINEEKMRAIHNAESLPISINLNKRKQILFVGRINYADKRVDRLIDIWEMIYRKAPDWELILVGDGGERKPLEMKMLQMKLERIRFVGHSDNVSDYYQDASILCLTSTFEGWPLCLTEAQAYGVVPIAFDCTLGVHEILAPSGVNGILIPPFKKKKYARALLELINNPEQLQAMKLNVIRKSKEYSPEIVGNKWLKLFNSLYN
ncbi:MAG: glycosyltransferase [Bacteroides sp.]